MSKPNIRYDGERVFICEHCNEPITLGLVTVAEVDGKPIYLHQENDPNASIDASVIKDCTFSYVLSTGRPLQTRSIPISELESMADRAE